MRILEKSGCAPCVADSESPNYPREFVTLDAPVMMATRPVNRLHLHAPLSQGTLRLSPRTAPRSRKAFDMPSVHEVHHRCSDEVFFSWLNALVQGSDQII